MKKVIFIRHGTTEGNMKKRYIGKTNENLCKKGKLVIHNNVKNGIYPQVDIVISSPMKRCLETANIIYPSMQYRIIEKLRECDFGDFENKNYCKLKDNVDYQKWIDSNGELPFPNGESIEVFKNRSKEGFLESINIVMKEEVETVVFVVHGGTIMAIMSQFCNDRKSYFDWMIGNGKGYICNWNGEFLQYIRDLSDV